MYNSEEVGLESGDFTVGGTIESILIAWLVCLGMFVMAYTTTEIIREFVGAPNVGLSCQRT